MRCVSCDLLLTDYESTRKSLRLEFVSLCNDCLSSSDMEDIYLLDRPDLKHADDHITYEEGTTYLEDILTQPGGLDEDSDQN
jgi:hypothetical protein